MEPTALVIQKTRYIRPRLMQDFLITNLDAAAIIGNAAYECGGFETYQEIAPTVSGSRGGWGWMQWTGSRRRGFEAYCDRNNFDVASDEAQYKWLFLELRGAEKRAITAVKSAEGLEDKVIAFESSFLRAGVKNYAKRIQWAETIQAIPPAKDGPTPVITPEPPEMEDKTMEVFRNLIILLLVVMDLAITDKDGWLDKILSALKRDDDDKGD